MLRRSRASRLFRVVLIHHPPTERRATIPAADRRRRVARRAARARRRAGAARPRPRRIAELAAGAAAAHSGGRRAVGVGRAGRSTTIPPATISIGSTASPGAWRCDDGLARLRATASIVEVEPADAVRELVRQPRRSDPQRRRTAPRRRPDSPNRNARTARRRRRRCARCARRAADRAMSGVPSSASARSRSIMRLRDVVRHRLDHLGDVVDFRQHLAAVAGVLHEAVARACRAPSPHARSRRSTAAACRPG